MEGVFSNGEGGDFLKCGEGGWYPFTDKNQVLRNCSRQCKQRTWKESIKESKNQYMCFLNSYILGPVCF